MSHSICPTESSFGPFAFGARVCGMWSGKGGAAGASVCDPDPEPQRSDNRLGRQRHGTRVRVT